MISLWKGEFSRLLFFLGVVLILVFRYRWEVTVFRQSECYSIKVVYQARPAVSLSDLVKCMRLPRSPLHLSGLDK